MKKIEATNITFTIFELLCSQSSLWFVLKNRMGKKKRNGYYKFKFSSMSSTGISA